MKRVGIGGDHAGFEYKQRAIVFLEAEGYEVKDFGPFSEDSVDYPDYIHPMSSEIESGALDAGIAICGSGNGVCMTANKHEGIRAAYVWNSEIAALARQHNDANVICLPARFVSYHWAEQFIITFLTTAFEGGRHENRVNKIACQ